MNVTRRYHVLITPHATRIYSVIVAQEGVNITPDGMRAVIKLSDGDMRKCLNVLQVSG